MGNCSEGSVPFVISRRSGWVNFPSVSSSSVGSIARVSATGVVIELGRDVCRFWYAVLRLSSVRATCADALALWCVNASWMHASRRSSRTECGLQWCPESLHLFYRSKIENSRSDINIS